MPSFIVHNKGAFNIYSTISDGFKWVEAIDKQMLTDWYKEEYGREGLRELPERLEAAEEKGISGYGVELTGVLRFNTAGADDKHLTFHECIKQFVTLKDSSNE